MNAGFITGQHREPPPPLLLKQEEEVKSKKPMNHDCTAVLSRSASHQAVVIIKIKTTYALLLLLLIFLDLFGYYAECHFDGTLALSEEKRLIKQLIDNYTIDGKFGRPIKAMNATLKVGYGISLVQIIDVDEKDQVLTTNVWCKYVNKFLTNGATNLYIGLRSYYNREGAEMYRFSIDERLKRFVFKFPEEHDNITIVRVPINTIWKPDFVLYNYADERLAEHRSTMALIDPEGYVTWIPPAIFKSTCFIDTTYFPFDEQSCHMKFGSWTYNGNALDPFFIDDKEYIELSEYVPSQEWVILEHWAQKNVAYYECCPNEPYPDLTFYLKLRRRATFYSYTLILPCVLLSFITMVLFMLPPETPAKMLLGINIFVGFFMLLLLLKDSTPPTAKQIPIIGAYYCFNMVMTTCSTFLCSILVDMHYRADKRNPPGRWLTYIVIEIIARAMFFYIPPNMVALQESQKRAFLKKKRLAARLKSTRPLSQQRQKMGNNRRKSSPSCCQLCFEELCDCVIVKAPKTRLKAPDCRQIAFCDNVKKPNSNLLEADEVCRIDVDTETIVEQPVSNSDYLTQGGAGTDSCLGCRSSAQQPEEPALVISSATFSPIKRGVFVGATVDGEAYHRHRGRAQAVSVGSCLENNCGNINPKDDDEFLSEQSTMAKRYRRNRSQFRQHGNNNHQQTFFPSSSFDLKHYNKFNVSQDKRKQPND